MSPILAPILGIAAPLAMFTCGLTVLVANPNRKANRSVFCLSSHVSIWLVLREVCSMTLPNVFWFQTCITAGTLAILHLAYTVEVIISNSWRARSWGFILVASTCIITSLFPWFDTFAKPARITESESQGTLYFIYLLLLFICFSYFAINTTIRILKLDYVIKNEIKAIILPASTIGVAILLLMLLRRFTPIHIPRSSSSILLLCLSLWLSRSICTTPIFGAQEIFKVLFRIGSIALPSISATIVAMNTIWEGSIMHLFIATICVILTLATLLLTITEINKCNRHYRRDYIRRIKVHRSLSRCQTEEAISDLFDETIGKWNQSKLAVLYSPYEFGDSCKDPQVKPDYDVFYALSKYNFITPEMIPQCAFSDSKLLFSNYLARYDLGALIMGERCGTTQVTIAMTKRPSLKPFSRREAQQLIEYASLAGLALARVRLLSHVAHSDRLVTLGILGASIAHEIRNPLFAIKTFADLLPSHYESPEFRLQFSKMVGEEATRIDSLLTDMMNLGKPRMLRIGPTSLNTAVGDTLDLLVQKIRTEGIECKRSLNARQDTIETDSTIVRQILLNLCLNAIQALHDFPGKRSIVVCTANTDRGFEFVIRDSGPGIPLKARKKMFVRFHTSKVDGTGLGLWLCRELVTSVGGSLDLDPFVPGEGATFRMTLPQSQPKPILLNV